MTTCLCKTPLTLRCYTVQSQHTLGAFEERSRSWLCVFLPKAGSGDSTPCWFWCDVRLPSSSLSEANSDSSCLAGCCWVSGPWIAFLGWQNTNYTKNWFMVHAGASERLRIWKILTGKDAVLRKETEKNCLQKRWYRPLCTHSLFTETGVVANEDLTGLFTICSFHLSEHACSLSSALRRLYGITLIPLLFCIFLLNRCHLFIFLLSSSYSLTSSQLWVVEGVRQGIYGICSVTSSQTCQRINEVKRVCGRFDQPALRWVTSGLNSLEFCFPQNS